MTNETISQMNFEEFLRGKLNSTSLSAPKSLAEAVNDPNLPEGITILHGKTLKHRVDSMDAYSQKLISGKANESFSVAMTEEQEERIREYTTQFYGEKGFELYKEDSTGLSDTYFLRNNDGDTMIVTYTIPFDNIKDRCIVSTTRLSARKS